MVLLKPLVVYLNHVASLNRLKPPAFKNFPFLSLMIEIYKIINQIAPPIMNSLFVFRENMHNVRNYQILSSNTRKTVRYSFETISYR